MIKIKTDSRLVTNGDTFVAIKGHTVDGHDYIEQAIKNSKLNNPDENVAIIEKPKGYKEVSGLYDKAPNPGSRL